MHGIYQQIEWEELLQAVKKVANGKYPGLNNVPPDAFKELLPHNLNILYSLLNAHWQGEIKLTEWYED